MNGVGVSPSQTNGVSIINMCKKHNIGDCMVISTSGMVVHTHRQPPCSYKMIAPLAELLQAKAFFAGVIKIKILRPVLA